MPHSCHTHSPSRSFMLSLEERDAPTCSMTFLREERATVGLSSLKSDIIEVSLQKAGRKYNAKMCTCYDFTLYARFKNSPDGGKVRIWTRAFRFGAQRRRVVPPGPGRGRCGRGDGRGEETRRPNFSGLFQVSLGEYGFSRAVCLSFCRSVRLPPETRPCGRLTGKF